MFVGRVGRLGVLACDLGVGVSVSASFWPSFSGGVLAPRAVGGWGLFWFLFWRFALRVSASFRGLFGGRFSRFLCGGPFSGGYCFVGRGRAFFRALAPRGGPDGLTGWLEIVLFPHVFFVVLALVWDVFWLPSSAPDSAKCFGNFRYIFRPPPLAGPRGTRGSLLPAPLPPAVALFFRAGSVLRSRSPGPTLLVSGGGACSLRRRRPRGVSAGSVGGWGVLSASRGQRGAARGV